MSTTDAENYLRDSLETHVRLLGSVEKFSQALSHQSEDIATAESILTSEKARADQEIREIKVVAAKIIRDREDTIINLRNRIRELETVSKTE